MQKLKDYVAKHCTEHGSKVELARKLGIKAEQNYSTLFNRDDLYVNDEGFVVAMLDQYKFTVEEGYVCRSMGWNRLEV